MHQNIGRNGELGIVANYAPCIIATMGNQRAWPQEARANARLIAAAPLMLDALRTALQAIGDTYDARDNDEQGEMIRDIIAGAIAAATGEEVAA